MKSHIYTMEAFLEIQKHQRSIRRCRFSWIASARVLVTAIFLIFIGISANAFEYDERHAMLIGLGKYEAGSKGVFRDLKMIVNDLETVGKALDDIGFKVEIYSDIDPQRKEDIEFLKMSNIDCQKKTNIEYKSINITKNPPVSVLSTDISTLIIDKLTQLEDNVGLSVSSKKLLLIYFTGHGGATGTAKRVLAAPASATRNPDTFYTISSLMHQLETRAKSFDKMIVIDACADKVFDDDVSSYINTDETVRLFSSELWESSFFDNKKGVSIFSYYFAQSLNHADDLGYGNYDGLIDADEIIKYVQDTVPFHSEKEQKKDPNFKKLSPAQHPWGASGSSRIVLYDETED